MNQPPLNPDALEAAATELFFTITAHKSAADVLGFDWKKLPAATRAPWETASSKVVAAYLSALPKPPEGWEAQAKNFMRVIDRLSAENEALKAAALPEVTSVEELDQLPQGAVIMATGGQWNPDYPELFLKAGYAHAPWLALDPSDRDDGENLESSGAVLKWRCDGSARVLYRPSEKP